MQSECLQGVHLPDDVPEDPEQERLAGLYVDAAALAERLQRNGDLASALQVARRAVSVEPLRD